MSLTLLITDPTRTDLTWLGFSVFTNHSTDNSQTSVICKVAMETPQGGELYILGLSHNITPNQLIVTLTENKD